MSRTLLLLFHIVHDSVLSVYIDIRAVFLGGSKSFGEEGVFERLDEGAKIPIWRDRLV